MKKLLCLILCLALILSCMITAGAEENDSSENKVYLLGDVNLDETVSVTDASDISRFLASETELSGLQKELGDIDKNGLEVSSATLIQRYLAGYDTDYAIGESAADENEGVIYTEKVPLYSYANQTLMTSEANLHFSTAYPDVPFISAEETIGYFSMFYNYGIPDIQEEKLSDDVYKYTFSNGTYVQYDYSSKEIFFSDYTTFLTFNGSSALNPFGATFPVKNDLYSVADDLDKYYGGDPCAISFDYNAIPMLKNEKTGILIPLQTFTDFFLSNRSSFMQYNGKGIFVLSSDTSTSPATKDYWSLYMDTDKKETISDALTKVNYYELCAVLEARYGLMEAHDISDFDSYFSRKGFKKKLLSGNLKDIESAQAEIAALLFEDLHSAATSYSPFLDSSVEINPEESPTYQMRFDKIRTIRKARTDSIGTPQPYERIGDTVFITFDGFKISNYGTYYNEDHVSSPDGDTIELFSYALKRLANEDSDVKNVVVDLSCNTGGAVVSAGFVMDALTGISTICLQNPNTGALHQSVYNFDTNLDGVINEDDKSLTKMGKNIALIISDSSFSCGNLVPSTLKILESNILLLGQTSGGGACEVGQITTATGAMMSISSDQKFVTMKNGYIRDIDGGVSPDIALSLNRMFDREYIAKTVSDYFG